MADPIPTRIHQHFKGEDKKYLVMAISSDVNPPHKRVVVYVPLYGENAGTFMHRDLDEWRSQVHRELEPGKIYDGDRFWPLPEKLPSFG